MWEKAIELCKELIAQYEFEMFDYHKLTAMLVCIYLNKWFI